MSKTTKIIHVPYCFYPDPVGGTEIYVEMLARLLQQSECECVIAAPTVSEFGSTYFHNGIKVRRYSVPASSPSIFLEELYGEGNSTAVNAFARILDEEHPDVVHLHAFTRGSSLRLVRSIKARGVPVIFTYHTPTVSCLRGTLLRWGDEICDGTIEVRRCAACTLHSFGVSKAASLVLATLPPVIGQIIASMGLSGKLWTALRMTRLVEQRYKAFISLMLEADQVVALSEWTRDLLIRNKVPNERIKLCRQGLDMITPVVLGSSVQNARSVDSDGVVAYLRLVFLGRIHPTKGLDILIQALLAAPDLKVELHIYGVIQDGSADNYLLGLKTLAKEDRRIYFEEPLPADQVISKIQEYDAVAVPSRCLETGPLVVLEAFAASVPVLGAKLGGIAELVQHEVNGLLAEPDSVQSWITMIKRCVEDKSLLQHLRSGIHPPRNAKKVAAEMLELYRPVIIE